MDLIIAHTLALMGVAILVAIVARRLSLPYTVGLVIAGAVLAFSRLDIGVRLTHDIIFGVILPPLLFEAAINIPWGSLRRDMVPVAVLSIFGVAISAIVVSSGMMFLLSWPIASALVFGVLIAATDPVAVIAMFKDTKVGGRLRLLVESESLFNDGVAAVFFALALGWASGGVLTPGGTAWQLVMISGGGVLVGLLTGTAATLLAGRTGDHMVEAAVTVIAAYGSFLIAQGLHLSGVLATVSAGLVVGALGLRPENSGFGLSRQGRVFVIELWDFLAFIANSVVFLLIGTTAARVHFSEVGFGALVIAVVLVLVGRAATVYPICLAFGTSRWKVEMRHQHILWWGGLRGALALALALALPEDMPMHNSIVIATFAVVAVSVLVQGLTMKPLMRYLGLLRAE